MKGFKYYYLRFLRTGLRHRKSFVLGFVLIHLFLAFQIPNLKSFYSTDELQEDKISSLNEWREFKRNFRESQSSFFIVAPKPPRDFFSEAELCDIQQNIQQIPRSSELVKSVQSAFDLRQAYLDSETRLRFPVLVNLNCDTPTRSSSEMLAEFQELDVIDWETSLFAKKRNDLAVLISYQSPEAKAFPTSQTQNVWNQFQTSLNKIKSIDILPLGGADYQLWVAKARGDTAWIYLAVLFGIVAGLRLILGTWLSGTIYMTGLLFSLIFIYGFKALIGSPTDLLSDTLVPLLAISALEDFVFVSFVQLKDGYHWRKSLRHLLVPSFWTSLTTFIGFGSLVVSDLGIIQRMGLWTAIGCMLEWFIIFYITPLALALFWKKRTWVNMDKSIFKSSGKILSKTEGVLTKLLAPLCKLSFIVIPLAVVLSPPIQVEDSLEEVFKKNHPFTQGLNYLQETRGWKGRIELQVQENFPKEKWDQVLSTLQATGLISNFDRAEKTKHFITRALPEDFLPLANRLAESSEIVSSFYGLDGSERISFYLKDGSTKSFEKLNETLKKVCSPEECHLVGSLYTKSQFTQVVAETFIESSMLSLVLIGSILFFLAYFLKRTHEILPMILASLWAPLTLFAVIKTFGISINFVTCIVITVLVGLAGDNVIQFLFADKKSTLQGIGQLKGGAASCFVLMSLVSLIFLLAPFQPVRMMGALTATGFVAILIGDVLVLEILLNKRVNKLPKN
ncbi:hypothetical protein [Bdellovibrio sp. HCB337]|uniref:hypothetical protein n=1 Tax=Bdellovibrio sp. HCB337 TaxID=3394358 RepID=UPI0039A4B67D